MARLRSTGASVQKVAPSSASSSTYYAARCILEENADSYLIAWEGTDHAGEPYKSTWEPKSNANAALLRDWEQRGLQHKAADGPGADNLDSDDEPADGYYAAKAIVAERGSRYLVSWQPDPNTGAAFERSWEPKSYVSEGLIVGCKEKKRLERRQNRRLKRQSETHNRTSPQPDPFDIKSSASESSNNTAGSEDEVVVRVVFGDGKPATPSDSLPTVAGDKEEVVDEVAVDDAAGNEEKDEDEMMDGAMSNDGKPTTFSASPPIAASNGEKEEEVMDGEVFNDGKPTTPCTNFLGVAGDEEKDKPTTPSIKQPTAADDEEVGDTVVFDDDKPATPNANPPTDASTPTRPEPLHDSTHFGDSATMTTGPIQAILA